MARCALEFEGEQLPLGMNESISFSDVLAIDAAWLRGKTVLLVCNDDLWSKENEHVYLHDITKLLRYAPKIWLLISTCNRNIAKITEDSGIFPPLCC